MNNNSFIFDLNKCVGCMACVTGCSIQNKGLLHLNWRTINTFNQLRHPDLPLFHFSLACNHCQDAPCMKNCPALAYSLDPITGAVIHHAEACIGCTYCTWACPYDAPKFNHKKGIIEKCDFCTDRIAEGNNPACVDACPVAALEFTNSTEPNENEVVPGFSRFNIRPSIILMPLRSENNIPQIMNLDLKKPDPITFQKLIPAPPSKVDLKKEWILVIFTLLTTAMAGWMWSHIQSGLPLHPVIFISSGIMGLLLSSVHLGKKTRAWRSVLNIRNSWLSREIVAYVAFYVFGTLYLLFPNKVLDIFTLLAGMMALASIDAVYMLLERKESMKSHSALVILTGIMVFSFLSGIIYLAATAAILKGVLYIYRKILYLKMGEPWHPFWSIIRLISLSIIPLTLIFGWITLPALTLVIIALGEIIDRAEFYDEAEARSPQNELDKLSNKLNH